MWRLPEVKGVFPTFEPCACCWTSLNTLLLGNFSACCHVLNLWWDIFLEFLCQKWVLFMSKHRFSLKFHLNKRILAKVTNKTSLRTFSKMKNLSQIWTESYRIMDYYPVMHKQLPHHGDQPKCQGSSKPSYMPPSNKIFSSWKTTSTYWKSLYYFHAIMKYETYAPSMH